MDCAAQYLSYLKGVKRFSSRTVEVYSDVLASFGSFTGLSLPEGLDSRSVREYSVFLLDKRSLDPRTVNLHLSVLSGFSKWMVREGLMKENPVRAVPRPKVGARLPEFYREESMKEYLRSTAFFSCAQGCVPENYTAVLSRLIVSLLYSTGLRRSELISLRVSDLDLSRKTLTVRGKGDKMRQIPLVGSVIEELSLYLELVLSMNLRNVSGEESLLLTPKGGKLYPVFVERVVKQELGGVAQITQRRSPHVLRHTLATELLDDGADLESIKELLGHSSLAATQVYTHNSMEKLRKVYQSAHPMALKEKKK